ALALVEDGVELVGAIGPAPASILLPLDGFGIATTGGTDGSSAVEPLGIVDPLVLVGVVFMSELPVVVAGAVPAIVDVVLSDVISPILTLPVGAFWEYLNIALTACAWPKIPPSTQIAIAFAAPC